MNRVGSKLKKTRRNRKFSTDVSADGSVDGSADGSVEKSCSKYKIFFFQDIYEKIEYER